MIANADRERALALVKKWDDALEGDSEDYELDAARDMADFLIELATRQETAYE